MDYKSKRPVATFTCSCGFVYSRMGPDKDSSDRYRIGRKKHFGDVWVARLKEYLQEGTYSVREIARIFQCDPKTILKFDQSLNIGCFCQLDERKMKLKDEVLQEKVSVVSREVVTEEQVKQNKNQAVREESDYFGS